MLYPPGKILPPSLVYPPSFFEIFSIPPAWQISEKSYTQLNFGGINYDTKTIFEKTDENVIYHKTSFTLQLYNANTLKALNSVGGNKLIQRRQ